MAGSYSITNTKEVVRLAKLLTVHLVKALKAGGKLELDDLVAFIVDPEVVGALNAAMHDIDKVKYEARELDWRETLELGKYVYDAITEILVALKG